MQVLRLSQVVVFHHRIRIGRFGGVSRLFLPGMVLARMSGNSPREFWRRTALARMETCCYPVFGVQFITN